MRIKATFPVLLEAFFTDRLMLQQKASPNTIASHRDTFRLLLGFAQERLKKAPSKLTIEDLDAPFVGSFLEHLEKVRGNTSRSRNVRLAAIHSFFKYVALEEPSCSALAQRIMAMPNKRFKRKHRTFDPSSFIHRLQKQLREFLVISFITLPFSSNSLFAIAMLMLVEVANPSSVQIEYVLNSHIAF